jgi:hypothetical protein
MEKAPCSRLTVSTRPVQIRNAGFDKEVQKHLGVHGGLKDGTTLFQFPLEQMGIDEVAVVGDGIGAAAVGHHEGLAVGQNRTAGGGVAHMSNGGMAAQLLHGFHVENIMHQPHALVKVDPVISVHGNAGAFLSPVLQGVKAEIGHLAGLFMVVDAKQSTGLAGSSRSQRSFLGVLVVHKGSFRHGEDRHLHLRVSIVFLDRLSHPGLFAQRCDHRARARHRPEWWHRGYRT